MTNILEVDKSGAAMVGILFGGMVMKQPHTLLIGLIVLLSLLGNGSRMAQAAPKFKQLSGRQMILPLKKTITSALIALLLATGTYQPLGKMQAEPAIEVKIIAPGFRVPHWRLAGRIEQLKARGFQVSLAQPSNNSIEARKQALIEALTDPDCVNLVCARGGFGTSDLLPYIPYDQLHNPKRVIGYSDISSLISALWTQSSIVGISGPMPGAVTWRTGSEEMRVLLGIMDGTVTTGSIPVQRQKNSNTDDSIIEGTLYGGDMSVLTNLIGTPYMPASLDGYILFLEALGESAYRVLRYLNQWQQSGTLDGVHAIVLGRFDKLGGVQASLYKRFAARVSCPVYTTSSFGHRRPLYPIPVGGHGKIVNGKLIWQLPEPQ